MKRYITILFLCLCLFLVACNLQESDREQYQVFDNSVEPQGSLPLANNKNTTQTNEDPSPYLQQLGHTDFEGNHNPSLALMNFTSDEDMKQYLINKYQVPKEWGERVTGVKTKLATDEKVIALTLDACGGLNGSQYDAELIYFLRQEQVPATLFINARWIDTNYWTTWALNRIPLFEIENHGTEHRPLSINGNSAWGIKGTEDASQIVDEVLYNHRKIEKVTGRTPRFFRSGTAYYDEVGVKIANEIGEQVVNYNVLGDAGATFTKEQVRDALLNAESGSIVLLHMNKPAGETAEGLKLAIPELKRRGFRFVKLEDYPLM